MLTTSTSEAEPSSEFDTASSSIGTINGCPSSDMLGSECDFGGDSPSSSIGKKSSKSRARARSSSSKKIKYWTLPTMSSGTFNPSMLTARQQLQYLAQKSRLGEESDSLELSPLRLDRIKFEEMKSLTLKEQEFQSHSSQAAKNTTNFNNTKNSNIPMSPSNRIARSSSSSIISSKLKDTVCTASTPLIVKKKVKEVKIVLKNSPEETPAVVLFNNNANNNNNTDDTDASNIIENSTTIDNASLYVNTDISISSLTTTTSSKFNYEGHRKGHFENYLKDFATRLGHALDGDFMKRKRNQIINKGLL